MFEKTKLQEKNATTAVRFIVMSFMAADCHGGCRLASENGTMASQSGYKRGRPKAVVTRLPPLEATAPQTQHGGNVQTAAGSINRTT